VFSIIVIALAVVMVSCGGSKYGETEFWNDVLAKYSKDTTLSSIILVKYTEGSNAELSYYIRKDGDWQFEDSCSAFVGKNGIGKVKEGDAMTPIGDFNVLGAFGILPNPGTEIPYIDVKSSTFACDDNDSEYYNQIIDTVETGHRCKGEDMFNINPEYNYGMVLDYNKERVQRMGSNIFFHCTGEHPYTGGCIAVKEQFIKHVMETCGSTPKFCIYPK